MPVFPAFLLALTGHAALATGQVLMKRAFLPFPGRTRRSVCKGRCFWNLGFAIMNTSGVFHALAVSGLPPQVITAGAGFGILTLLLLSHRFLGEAVSPKDLKGATLITVALALLALTPPVLDRLSWSHLSLARMLLMMAVPCLIFLVGTFASRGRILLPALSSGMASGLLVLLLKILQARHGYLLSTWLKAPEAWLYLGMALLALLALNLALARGPMMEVGPAQYAGLLLYPPLCALWAGAAPPLWHWPLYLAIALGSKLLLSEERYPQKPSPARNSRPQQTPRVSVMPESSRTSSKKWRTPVKSPRFFLWGIFFLTLTLLAKFPLRHLLAQSEGITALLAGSLPSFFIIPTVFLLLWSFFPNRPQRALLSSLLLGIVDEGQQLLTAATADVWDLMALLVATGLCALYLVLCKPNKP